MRKTIIDLGTKSAKVLSVTVQKNCLIVDGAYEVPGLEKFIRHGAPAEKAAEQVVIFLKENDLKGNIILHISSTRAESHLVTVPDDVKNPVQHIYSSYFKGNNFACMRLSQGTYLTGYLPAEEVERIVDCLRNCNYKVEAVDTEASAMIYLAGLYAVDPIRTRVYLNIGYQGSSILIEDDRIPVGFGRIPAGMQTLLGEVSESIGAPISKVQDYFIRLGVNPKTLPAGVADVLAEVNITPIDYGASVKDAVENYLDQVVEAMKTGRTFRANDTKFILMGGGTLTKGLDEILREHLGIRVEPFEVVSEIQAGKLKLVNRTNKKLNAIYATALGLGLREVVR